MSDVLVVAEHRRGELRDVSFELVTAGVALATDRGGDLHVAVVGDDTDAFASSLNVAGVDTVHAVAGDTTYNHDVYVQALQQLHAEVDPEALLAPHTVDGMDYAPALAEALSVPVLTDVTGVESGSPLTVTREQYGSKFASTYEVDADQYVLTLRPAEWEETTESGGADVRPFEPEIDAGRVRTAPSGFEEADTGDVDISDAEFIVAIGRGIEEEENLALVEDLCEATGATLAASRPIVDNGWLPKGRQVGQSGKSVSPTVYIAIGISGAVQHVAGIKGADTIVAINTDPNAPIMDVADYAIVDDLFDVVPALTDRFQ